MDDTIRNDDLQDDGIQHGIDDSPTGDAAKGGVLGAVGGAVVGALAGGPLGAVIGGVAGGLASAGAVAAVDQIDNDDTVTGVGSGVTSELDEEDDVDLLPGNEVPGIQTGGYAADGTPDTRGMMEKTADTVTGDRFDDKTGRPVDTGIAGTMPSSTYGTTGSSMGDVLPGNDVPGIQTGGRAADGTPDTRGIMEKTADTATGDPIDDKTGKPVV